MATVTPVAKSHVDAQEVLWANVSTSDTITEHRPKSVQGVAGCLQATGTWGGGTLRLKISNDGTTWFNASDIFGNTIGLTANGMVEFTTAAMFMKPVMESGASDYVDCVVLLRG